MAQDIRYLKETPSQTAGPYVHIGLTPNFCDISGVYEGDLGTAMVNDKTTGERITVTGRLFDGAGALVRDAVIEIWQADGSANADFPFNQPANQGRSILLAGRNFGCGSSREHAPWALTDLGLRAIVSSEIADIFRNNSLKNGLLPIVLPEEDVQALMQRPDDELTIDVATRELRTPDGRVYSFPLDAFAQTCLLEGVDEMGYLLARGNEISQYEASHAR